MAGQIDILQVKTLDTELTGLQTAIDTHEALTNNPHGVTAAQVGAIATSARGAANGVASLDAQGKVPQSQIPALAMERLTVVANETARFALTVSEVQEGDVVKQTDSGATYIVTDDGNLDSSSGYTLLTTPSSAPVDSVFGRIGTVSAAVGDYNSDQIINNSTVAGDYLSDALETTAGALTTHANRTDNPHGVTASQVGAYSTAQVDSALSGKADASTVSSHTSNTSNPHSVTASQVGAYTTAAADAITDAIEAKVDALPTEVLYRVMGGATNGANTDFTARDSTNTATVAAYTPTALVLLNNLPQIPGVDGDWVSGNTIFRFATAPPADWDVNIIGMRAPS